MSEKRILLIERAGKKSQSFAAALEKKEYDVEVVPTGHLALKYALQTPPAVIILNAASLGSSGERLIQRLRAELDSIPLIHIFPAGSEKAKGDQSPADIVLIMPFTARKLINRLKIVMPGARKDAVSVGPISLAPASRVVEAYGREMQLTPKAADLLRVFLKHPGKTLDRSFLMQHVWDTDYVGDTRTLDVHVRWVREAIESEPGKPKHIVTVRGVGYRFEPGKTDSADS
jgi:DNA-binding response OmpR family regulator